MQLKSREEKQKILEQCFISDKAEFIAVYGRRRIGKTHLIKQFFSKKKKSIFFNITGSKDAPLKEQIAHFADQMGEAFFGNVIPKAGKNWDENFKILTNAIKNTDKSKKIILFFDEFPWMATKNSRLVQNLEYYWNQHWSNDKRIKLIICGSSASWIIDKIINNKGGLHNRVTETIHLEPFNLLETKKFLTHMGVKLNHKQITLLYMVMGGIPYYLSKIKKGFSAAQIIEELSFKKGSFFLKEFDNLFASLFENHADYTDIIKTIAANRYGIGQEELFQKASTAIKGIGGLTKLKALEDAGFIISFKPHFNKAKGIYYKIVDEFTLFYLYWINPIRQTLLKNGMKKGYWDKLQSSPSWNAWAGLSFEAVCDKHLFQISNALKLSPTAIPTAWRYIPTKKSREIGAQVDLLFDRDDDAITICEIKYTDKPFKIDKQYANNLLNKLEVFKSKTKTTKQLFIVMITASGLQPSMYSEEIVTNVVNLDDLFIEE